MLRLVLAGVVALGALPASAAYADVPVYGCDVQSAPRPDVDSGFEAVITGSAARADGGAVLIRCSLYVDGAPVAEPVTGAGDGVAAAAGRVTFAAWRYSSVWILAEAITPGGYYYSTWEPHDPYAIASADEALLPTGHQCGFRGIQQDDMTGQNIEGVAYGVVAQGGSDVAIRCYVTVNGAEVSSTPTYAGRSYATVVARLTFTATDTDSVVFCAETTYADGYPYVECSVVGMSPLVPRTVDVLLEQADYARDVVRGFDHLTCPMLRLWPGYYGGVRIDQEGDVFIDDVLVYDCPWYDDSRERYPSVLAAEVYGAGPL